MPNETNPSNAGPATAKQASTQPTCSSPATVEAHVGHEVQHLHAVLTAIAQFAAAVTAHGGTTAPAAAQAPKLLTSIEFAARLGGVEPETVEHWCRQGRFPYAQCWGRAGWRIPEFYLYRKTPPADQLAFFEDGMAGAGAEGGSAAAPSQATDDSSESAESSASAPHGKPELTSDGFDPQDIYAFRKHRQDASTPDAAGAGQEPTARRGRPRRNGRHSGRRGRSGSPA